MSCAFLNSFTRFEDFYRLKPIAIHGFFYSVEIYVSHFIYH